MSTGPDALVILQRAALAADRIKAENIVAFDVSARLPLTDAFLLVSGRSERQVGAIVDEIEAELGRTGRWPQRLEGKEADRWVLLDYDDAIIHVQHAQDREFYGLDSLWKDCPAVNVA